MFLHKLAQSKSGVFIFVLSSFIIGAVTAPVLKISRDDSSQLIFILILLIVAVAVVWPKKEWRLLSFGALFFFFSFFRFAITEPPFAPSSLIFYHDRWVAVEGIISYEPLFDGKQKIILNVQKLKVITSGDQPRAVNGKMIMYLDRYPEYHYGDFLKLNCNLTKPLDSEDGEQKFSYPAYLARQGVWSVCLNARIKEVASGRGNWAYGKILVLKNILVEGVNKILPEPQSSFLGGLLYGARQSIPADLKNAFSRTGTAHIIAVSGYNITIIAAAILAILQGLSVPRQRAFWVSVVLIAVFVLLTGASASVVRAGLMGIIVLWARHLGRLSQVGRVLVFTAFLMLLFNPRLIFFDAGFQLSFASTLGILYLSPILENYSRRWPKILGFKESLLTTLSAILATAPLIAYSFGSFSLVAPIVNLLILPAIPYTMALGFGAMILGLLYFPLGQVWGSVVWLPLTYIIKVVEYFSGWGWAAIAVPQMSWWMMFLAYAILIWIGWRYRRASNDKYEK
ncbi:MAG: ComEC/Rec2 family competence protein [Candidatus Magasanikbacteria bacterium]|nr:ComEC/Rec2 family competence protein [Candidatus Magasanikbacteria bacterium]